MMRVVIIDDEYWTRDSIRRLGDWRRLGIDQIEDAEDGQKGLRIIKDIVPEIVITDMKMRGMDGVELLQKLTEDYPFIRKIVISGYDDFAYTKQAIHSRVDEYILKPIHPDELNQALEKAIRELRITQGLHAVQPFDKELLKINTAYKHIIARAFQELQLENIGERFRELGKTLEKQQNMQPGMNNSLYKQFMLLLEEQAALAGADMPTMLSPHTQPFFVTDDTSISQWTDALAGAYTLVLEKLIQKRKIKNRIDIEEVTAYIERSFTESINLESIAGQFFVSKEHLSRIFKQETGTTVMDMIIVKRMEKAKQLLQNPGISLKSAAEAVGYSDLSYFHRIFKKITGTTPAQVRQDHIH